MLSRTSQTFCLEGKAIARSRWNRLIHSSSFGTKQHSLHEAIGFIGLGHMGSKMVHNFLQDGHNVVIYDNQATAYSTPLLNKPDLKGKKIAAKSIDEFFEHKVSIIFTMLPRDNIVDSVSSDLLRASTKHPQHAWTHISCSTISPITSRNLLKKHLDAGHDFVAAPVFARPDGLLRREATFMTSGSEKGKHLAEKYLKLAGKVVDFGADVGAANIVKLCGNFLIAASIESIAESMALAEKHGVDREEVMKLLSSTIFDCLIYRGYGQRVSQRDHRPGGFSLDLGAKDVSLVQQAAHEANVPMPFLSTLVDRFTSAKAKGRGAYDWSAVGLNVAEDAGINISQDIQRNEKNIKEDNRY